MQEFAEWDSFYAIVGSAAGALIGLQFVVMTLIAQRPPLRAAEAGAAFATPTIVYFGTVLLVAALQRAPWHVVIVPAIIFGLIGLGGVVYSVIVARRIWVQITYKPVIEDWLCNVAVPLAAYVMLVLSAVAVPIHTRESLFGVGAATLTLLFVSIHNAWDAIAYHVWVKLGDPKPDGEQSKASKKENR
jgi:hypothetical protein